MPQNPPELPVRDFPTPEVADGILVEIIDNDKGAYAIVPIGSRCPEGSDSAYVGYELVDVKTSGDYKWTYRYWANPSINQDVYNASIEYSGEAAAYPIYTRNYVERRPYTPRARGTTLRAVIGAVVTNGGSLYDTPPTVTISSGGGTGATAEALLYRGSVIFVRIKTEGQNYSSVPTISFSGGGGSGAAATALIQSQGAFLVKEDLGKLPEGDPRYGLYDLVVRVYETLPGPVLSGLMMSGQANGALVTTTTQILATGAANYIPNWLTLDYSDVPLDDNRKKRSVSTLLLTAFPILTEYDQDPILQYLIVTTYQIVEAAAVVAPSVVNGIITQFKKIDQWRSLKIVEDHTALLDVEYDEQRFNSSQFPSLFDYTQYFWTAACGAFSTQRDGFSAMVESRVHISFSASKQTISGLTLIPNGIHLGNGIQETNILNDAGSLTYSGSCSGTISFPASSPSFSDYVGTIQGTEQLITGESALFRAGIYRNTGLYTVML